MSTGWSTARLDEACTVVNGGTPKTSVQEYWDGPHAWITPAEMGKRDSLYCDATRRTLTDAGLAATSATLLPPQSVILSSRAPIGHLVINTVPMATNQGCKGIVPGKHLDAKFLYYNLLHRVDELNALGTGTTFVELSATRLKAVDIPLPPLAEQKRIVAVLDEAFEAIERAEAIGDRSAILIQRLWDTSVLGYTTGDITLDEDGEEDGTALLARVLAERPGLWEVAEDEKLAAAPGRARRSSYSDPVNPDLADAPTLPVGWAWASLDQLAYFIVDYRGKTPPKSDHGIPVVSAANVGVGKLDLSEPRFVSKETYERWTVRGLPRGGDVFITTEAPVGRAAIYPEGEVLLPTRRVLLTRVNGCEPRFLMHCLLCGFPASFIQANSRHRGATVPRILKPRLLQTPIPLPPLATQRKIVQRLQTLERMLGKRRVTHHSRATQLTSLRSSLLQTAFQGRSASSLSTELMASEEALA